MKLANYTKPLVDSIAIFVLLGDENAQKPVRSFITSNREVTKHIHHPDDWKNNGFMPPAAIKEYEDRWDILDE